MDSILGLLGSLALGTSKILMEGLTVHYNAVQWGVSCNFRLEGTLGSIWIHLGFPGVFM